MAATAFDTSVIVPALLAWHEHHERALSILQETLASPHATVLPVPALVEAFAVMTRLPPPWRLKREDAHQLLAETFRGKAVMVGLDGDEAWSLLDKALASEVAGGATYDAHVGACARKAGAGRLATFNRRHFERLDLGGMELLVP